MTSAERTAPLHGPPPGGGRQQQRSALSTRRLLDACAALIAERGYERTTLADIGSRAGYSQGLVTRRFGSKTNLMVVLVERMTARYGPDRIAETIGDRTGAVAVTHLVRQIREDARRAPEGLRSFYALMYEGLKPIPALHERLRDLNRGFLDTLIDVLAAGLDAGTLRPGTDPAAAATMVASCLRGVAFFWLLDPERFDIVDELESLARQLDAALAP
jgi:AcrR family transcriptional regulator